MAKVAQEAAVAENKQKSTAFLDRFLVLKGAVPELWITFAVKLLGILAYAIMNSMIVLWLRYDLGFKDVSAGAWVGVWTTLLTLFTVLVGSLTDAIGLRKSFFIGVWVCVFARAVMTFTTVKWIALGFGLLPLALGEALGTPVLVAAVRRYSTTAQRAISFSMFYVVMNVGFLIAGQLCDWVRQGLGDRTGRFMLPVIGIELSTYRVLFLISLAVEIAILPILYFLRGGVEATDEGVKITPEVPKYPRESMGKAFSLMIRDTARETARLVVELCRQPGFHRLLVFLILIAFVKLVFVQMSYVYPVFGIRELGEGAPIGRLWSVTNSALIVLLVPIVGALFQKVSAYKAVTLGCAVTAASLFILALPMAWFKPLSDGIMGHWVGHLYLGLSGEVNPWYVMLFLYVVVLSVGEAFYSPRVYEYAAAIAPKGQEASYGALSYLPFFVAKLLVGTSSGILLAQYCPETGPRNSQAMWLILALATTIAPVGLLLLRRWIRVREAGREE